MKYLYSIYFWIIGSILFLIILLFTITIGWIIKKETLYKIISKYFRFIFKAMLIKVETIYEKPIDINKAYIFMPNHISFIDVLLAGAYIPVYVNAIEAHTHFKWFLYGWAIKRFGQIPIDRTKPRSSWKSFQIAIERLKQGRSIIVFPEGHRSGDGHLQPFKKIPFKFAKEADADLIPMAFIGVEKLRKHKIWVKPHPIRIVFAEPITNQEIKKLSVEELHNKVREKITQMLNKYGFKK